MKPYLWPSGAKNIAVMMVTYLFVILSKVSSIIAPLFLPNVIAAMINRETLQAVY